MAADPGPEPTLDSILIVADHLAIVPIAQPPINLGVDGGLRKRTEPSPKAKLRRRGDSR